MKTKVWGLLWAEFDEKSMELDFTETLGEEFIIQARFEVCDLCNGKGTTVSHVENEGGGFTASEWNELDYEFREDYLNGVYDKPCPECNGKRVVPVPIEYCNVEENIKQIERLREVAEQQSYYERERESERRFGA